MKLERGSVYRIEFADHGQDFTDWYVKDGIVIDCQPFQARLWIGTKVTARAVELGQQLPIFTRRGNATTIKYPIVTIDRLLPEQAKEAEEAFRSWLQEIEHE